jgi:hypothetical protein
MATSYAGREGEFELGDGHSFVWLTSSAGQTVGLIEHHPAGPNAPAGALHCGGYVAWVPEEAQRGVHPPWTARHQLVAGGPGDEEHLTLSPSLACRTCPSHGFIRHGRWVAA